MNTRGRTSAIAPVVGLVDRLRGAPYAALSAAVLAVAAYLCLFNLDYAAVWHDEAPAVLIARNLLEQGDIVGWDGRNLVGGSNGRALNEDLREVWPPLTYLFNAAGIALFGFDETGARIMPALLGITSLVLLTLLLRQHLRGHSRLIFFILLFAAWSPQLLLFFRQSRYYAGMACWLIAAFYFYEHWWRTGRAVHLCALTLAAVLAFFNLYTAGAATMLAVAVWHLLFRARETSPRQWLALAASGGIVVALGAAYLVWLGVIGGARSGFLAFRFTEVGEYSGTTPLILLRLTVLRDLFTADWVSWPVFLWFACVLGAACVGKWGRRPRAARPARRSRSGTRSTPAAQRHPRAREASPTDLPLAAAGKVVLMGALFAVFSAAVSVQPVWLHAQADLRYFVGALPLLLGMKGLFADWVWRRSKLAAVAAVAVLLCSSAGAWPINMINLHTRESTLGLHLPRFVREIHRPYRDATRAVSDYLRQHAAQDDLVYVPGFADREALTFAVGDRVLFCCVLDQHSSLPAATVEALGARLRVDGTFPHWIVVFGVLPADYWERIEDRYAIAAQLDVYHYPTQRPELNLHVFEPLSAQRGVHVLRRREAP